MGKYGSNVYKDKGGRRLVIGPGGELLILGAVTGIAKGKTYFVDANSGNDAKDGLSWGTALKTMAAAFAKIASGDTIYFVGKIREQLTTPVQVFDVTIIGSGTRPRHADSTPNHGQDAANTWTIPASGATANPLVKVLQQGWRFENILFAGPTNAACVMLFRDGGAGNAERDASHAEFIDCRFASGQDGIEQSGGVYNIKIEDCAFHDLTGYAIKHTAGAGIAAPYRWEIVRNRFAGCANLMGAWAARQFKFWENDVKEITTNYMDFSGGSHNSVLRNSFDVLAANFDPTGKVAGSATDTWSNYLIDTIETGVPAD